LIITEFAVFSVKPAGGLSLVELMGTSTVADVRARTGACFEIELAGGTAC